MSEKHKFCFIHIEKSAGTSIRDTLAREFGIRHFKSWFYKGPFKGKGGQRAIDYIDLLGREKYESYFSFAFVRNPYERLVSWYSYSNAGKKTFEGWLSYFFEEVKLDQMAYLLDENGEIAVDFIGKFERLQKDFNRVCDHLNIPHQKLPVKNRSMHKHYRDYYTFETRDYVTKKLIQELELFGYEF